MPTIKRFEELKVWKDAVSIAVRIYGISSAGKLSKDFGARDQLRRAATSISNNIAEGFEYNNNRDFVKFLRYSKGSAGELRSNLFILKEASIIESDEYKNLTEQLVNISREIEGFIKYLKVFESSNNLKKRDLERNASQRDTD
jgi:four helix bundle protein